MSASSHESETFSRCVISLDAGISTSWAPDPEGPFDRLKGATAAIEVLFDELEEAGHVFASPGQPDFQSPQRGANGMMQLCEVQVAPTPQLTEPALAALAERIARLISSR